MPYSTENVLVKETPFACLALIHSKENGSYATEMAEELGFQQPTASDILSAFGELGVVKKGKRSKAQYYVINYEALRTLHKDKIWRLYDRHVRVNPDFDSENDDLPSEKQFEEALRNKDAKNAFNSYIKRYLDFSSGKNPTDFNSTIEESTVHQMLVKDFLRAFMYKTKSDVSNKQNSFMEGLKEAVTKRFSDSSQWTGILEEVYFRSVIESGNTLPAMIAYGKGYDDLF